jgi:predicted transcriptional regulator
MLKHTLKPIFPDADKKSDFEISEKRLGVTAVIEHDKVIGIITDGDIRRMLNERDFCRINCKRHHDQKSKINSIKRHGS